MIRCPRPLWKQERRRIAHENQVLNPKDLKLNTRYLFHFCTPVGDSVGDNHRQHQKVVVVFKGKDNEGRLLLESTAAPQHGPFAVSLAQLGMEALNGQWMQCDHLAHIKESYALPA